MSDGWALLLLGGLVLAAIVFYFLFVADNGPQTDAPSKPEPPARPRQELAAGSLRLVPDVTAVLPELRLDEQDIARVYRHLANDSERSHLMKLLQAYKQGNLRQREAIVGLARAYAVGSQRDLRSVTTLPAAHHELGDAEQQILRFYNSLEDEMARDSLRRLLRAYAQLGRDQRAGLLAAAQSVTGTRPYA